MNSPKTLSTKSEENFQDIDDLCLNTSGSSHYKDSSADLSRVSSNDSNTENGGFFEKYFQEYFYPQEELERCLIPELLDVIEEDNTCPTKIFYDTNTADEEDIKSQRFSKAIILNPEVPPYVPKKDKQSHLKKEKTEGRKQCHKPKEAGSKNYYLVKKYPQNQKNQRSEKKKKKEKKTFAERDGDWCCYNCKNVNFRFRTSCNKCQLSKKESEALTDEALNRIINYVNSLDKN